MRPLKEFDMQSGDATSSSLKTHRHLLLTPLRLPPVTDDSSKSSPSTATSTPTLRGLFTASLPSVATASDVGVFSFREETATDHQDIPSSHFDLGPVNGDRNRDTFSQNLMDISDEKALTVLDLFDPCKPTVSPVLEDVPTQPTIPSSVSSLEIPSPIKLRLKLTICSEMKPLSRLAQQIRDERQSTQTDDILYCKRVPRLTSHHIEHHHSSVTLLIFTENSREPRRMTDVSLQSTVAHVLYQLLEMIPFDYDQSILKLSSCEEYLRHDDVLCDLDYVYHSIKSLKPLQFVLVRKPIVPLQQKQTNIPFEQFCLNQHEKYVQSISQLKRIQSAKSLNKTKQTPSYDQTRSFFPFNNRRSEEFHMNINQTLESIACSFNRLLQSNSASEQINCIQEHLTYMKAIQLTCSDIPSVRFNDKQRDLKVYKMQIESQQALSSQKLNKLPCDLLLELGQYIQTYCQAFFIPYEMQIYRDDNLPIGLDLSMTETISTPQKIDQSSQPFTVRIDGLFSFPSNIKIFRILARIYHGNTNKGTRMTKLMSYVRNNSQENSSQLSFNEQLTFENVLLCELAREALIFFEVYANLPDDKDGTPMRLIGWCSQALFDAEHHLITGERYLGVIDATRTTRTGFYSLRNVSEQDCMILTVSFDERAFFWPDVQGREDIHPKNFTEIPRAKQADLSRILNRASLLLVDHSLLVPIGDQVLSTAMSDEEQEFSENERSLLWSYRQYLVHKPYALPKILHCRSFWDHPSLEEIYGLIQETNRQRVIDEVEALELLLPAFPDMSVRSLGYRSLISRIPAEDLIIYLPQLLQTIKFDYDHSSLIVEHLLRQSIDDRRLAHRLYWHLRPLILSESLHFIRYYYIFMSLIYVIDESFHEELQLEYDLCVKLNKVGEEVQTGRLNRVTLQDQLKDLNEQIFQAGQRSCRLPCQYSFHTNSIDVTACTIFTSFKSPVKLVFNPRNCLSEKYYSIYKIGDDLRQDQTVLQLLMCMDRIWQANGFDFRLSIFNVVPTHERCGFIEMVPESETLFEIENRQGTIKGSFGESALFDWLHSNNPTDRDFQTAIENLTYSCAGYCVATYILGIGDRHNQNIMVRKSGHLFHIDFGKYLGDIQKFVWFNRDRTPFIFTKQMLYAMSDGGMSNDAMHRFVDLCCDAFITLRENSSLLLLLLSHLCSSNVPNLNHETVRLVYDRLVPSLNYAQSIAHFTKLIEESLNSAWTLFNGLIHKIAQTTFTTPASLSPTETPPWSFSSMIQTNMSGEKVQSVRIVSYEQKRPRPSKYDLYKVQVNRSRITYHYRTYMEFYEFYERLKKQFPLIGLELKYSRQTEDPMILQRRVSEINDFLGNLFRLTEEVIASDLVDTFFHTIPRDQQINVSKVKSPTNRSPVELSTSNNQSKVCIKLQYDNGKLFVMVRHANNLPLINGNEPKPYCKCYLFPDERKLTKRKGKTAVSRNPILNDTFTYEMDLADIQKRVLRVSVWNNVLSVGNHVLGVVDIVLSEIDWSKEHSSDHVLIS